MSKIEYQDISDIIYALCVADTEIDSQLKEAQEKDSKVSVEWRLEQKENIKKGFKAVDKLRKELRLVGDPLHSKI